MRSPPSFCTSVIRAGARRAGMQVATRRDAVAVDILAGMMIRRIGNRWTIRAPWEPEDYRLSKRRFCNCPFGRNNFACAHWWAIRFLPAYAAEIAQRLVAPAWDGKISSLLKMETAYAELLDAASAYQPPDDVTLLHGIRLEAPHGGRPWVARIVGLCPTYEFAREFASGAKDYRDANKDGSRGVWLYYQLPPGLYEVKRLTDHGASERYFARVENLTMKRIEKREVLAWLSGAK